MPVPSIGHDVHYVARGSADGKFPAVCRAAKITEVAEGGTSTVGVMVFNPTGLYFYPLDAGGCAHDAENGPGTWHWPERVGE